MNWIFDTYSNLYTTAMMQEQNHVYHAATAKEPTRGRYSSKLKLFGRN